MGTHMRKVEKKVKRLENKKVNPPKQMGIFELTWVNPEKAKLPCFMPSNGGTTATR